MSWQSLGYTDEQRARLRRELDRRTWRNFWRSQRGFMGGYVEVVVWLLAATSALGIVDLTLEALTAILRAL